jgi:hypothetical protein
MDSTPPLKDNVWKTGLKRDTGQFVVQETHLIDRNSLRVRKNIYKANDPPKQEDVPVLI